MTADLNAARLASRSVCALIEALGMVAENQIRIVNGYQVAYGAKEFLGLITEYEIHPSVAPEPSQDPVSPTHREESDDNGG